jgi:mannose-6-phosphate isomerase-like protein (cupin superfamily)
MRIERWTPARDGAFSESALHRKLVARGYLHVRRSYPAGARAALPAAHHDRLEAVVSGTLRVTLGAESAILRRGDLVIVPRGEMRALEVVGASPVYSLQAVRKRTADLICLPGESLAYDVFRASSIARRASDT